MGKKQPYHRMNRASSDEVLGALRMLRAGRGMDNSRQDEPIDKGLFSKHN